MAIKLHLPGAGPAPAPTSGPDVFAALGISPAELIQNFINLRDAIEKLYGEAANQTEENALFAAGYRYVTRTDQMAAYVPPSLLVNSLPMSTIIIDSFGEVGEVAATSTIIIDSFA